MRISYTSVVQLHLSGHSSEHVAVGNFYGHVTSLGTMENGHCNINFVLKLSGG
ncbi:Hypothetical protein OINT_2001728 [Brucella intermedia LMG 3301]|uniref:Uncharacterized protein n=1 Tax=Brucella intermedia LMG 3301 TaxID=641118 RepID=C4WQF8_9HYPH|nr:Hypothetical protein OINT_2001728 [Brucella intermedia LMG 3301]